jgi:hypothetical protein
MITRSDAHQRLSGRLTVALPPDRAFRLFTPSGEQDWADQWKPYFPAATADDSAPGTVFQTTAHDQTTTWVVVDRAWGRHIRYARVVPQATAGTVTSASMGPTGTARSPSRTNSPRSPTPRIATYASSPIAIRPSSSPGRTRSPQYQCDGGMTLRWPRRPVWWPGRVPCSSGRGGGAGRAASRTASASATRSSVVGGGGPKSPSWRTSSQPRGAVRLRAWGSQRSYVCGSANAASGPTTAVDSL